MIPSTVMDKIWALKAKFNSPSLLSFQDRKMDLTGNQEKQ